MKCLHVASLLGFSLFAAASCSLVASVEAVAAQPVWAAASGSTETISDLHGDSVEVAHHTGIFNGVRIHYVTNAANREGAPTAVLLHGYPEFWFGWVEQIVSLTRAGYNVVAPDLRGFNHSEKPDSDGAYAISHSAEDVADLIREVSPSRKVVLVGHDWGGSVAWVLAYSHPELIQRLVVLNVPHPRQLQDVKKRPWEYPKEFASSAYVYVLGLPLLPEIVFQHVLGFKRAFKLFVLDNMVNPGNLTPAVQARIIESWKVPGALEAGTNFYRDGASYFEELPNEELKLPVSLVFGLKDAFMAPRFAHEFKRFQRNAEVTLLEEAGHYTPHDAPAEVSHVIRKALADAAKAHESALR